MTERTLDGAVSAVRVFNEAASVPMPDTPKLHPLSEAGATHTKVLAAGVRSFAEQMRMLGVVESKDGVRNRSHERTLRLSILAEEFAEYLDAEATSNEEEILDSLVDQIYIIVGTGLAYGMPTAEAFDEVQRANMDKFPGGVARRRDDGKIIKPEGWKPPNIRGLLEEARRG